MSSLCPNNSSIQLTYIPEPLLYKDCYQCGFFYPGTYKEVKKPQSRKEGEYLVDGMLVVASTVASVAYVFSIH